MKIGRKISGGKYKKARKKKKFERKGQERKVKVGETKTKIMKIRGGNEKTVSLLQNKINLVGKGKTSVVEIKRVLETPSNRFLARQNILTKGAVVETELGKAKITNRPSQEGNVQGILIE